MLYHYFQADGFNLDFSFFFSMVRDDYDIQRSRSRKCKFEFFISMLCVRDCQTFLLQCMFSLVCSVKFMLFVTGHVPRGFLHYLCICN